MSKGQRIPITVEFLAAIRGMDEVVGKIQNGMKNFNFDFSKNLKAAKLFDNYKNEYENFQSYIKDNSINPLEAKDVIKSGNNIIKMFRDIKLQYGDLSNVSMEMAKKLFPEAFSINVEKAQKYIKDLEADVEKLSKKKIDLLGAQTGLERAKKKLEDIKAIKIAPDFSKPIEDANNELEETKKKLTDLRNNSKKLSEAKDNTKAAKRALTTAKTNYTKTKNRFDAAEKGSPEAKALKQQLDERQKIREEADAKYNATLNKQKTIEDNLEKGNIGNLTSEEQAKAKELTASIREQEAAVRKLNDAKDNAPQTEEAKQKLIDDQTTAYDNQLQKVNQLKTEIEKLSTNTGNLEGIKKSLSDFGIDASNIQNLEDAKEVLKELENADTVALDEIRKSFVNMGVSADQAENLIEEMRAGLKGVASTSKDLDNAAKEVEQLRDQVLQFFSIGNAIQLFKRAVRSAFATVKELDKTMTETAVVTKFSVGDMWSQLPQYTQRANELGVSIKGAYEAATLYYQQGLKTNEVISVSNETLKMARIANIEAADATNLMTAALRGFNMEVNEANARNVSDVYSNLAAITAANTKEIGAAMSKTASIAKSANMEFSTTAALLAQIIETTREAPETAGTAMKTIIARFTEVKKLISQGDLMGTDEEGEVIDVNKIDTALKTVGISLKGFLQGTEGIDDIFLQLAKKWDGLDISTQRYIATMAAGSRQQSRFLAMMGDYDRTMELVSAANNSAGASQQQFEKTLDSMESKLAKLKNAWDEFAMGLANNEALKFFVDVLTVILNVINSIINALSGGGGLSKAFISFAAVLGGLKLGKSILDKNGGILGLLGGKEKVVGGATNAGSMASAGFTTGFKDKINKTKGFFKGFTKQGIKEIKASRLELKGEYDKALKNMEAAQERLKKAKTEKERVDNIEVTGSPEERKRQGGEKGRASAAANKELAAATDEVAAAEKRATEAGNALAPVTKTVQDGFNQAGVAAAGVGVAFNLLAGLLDSMGADDSTVELFTNIGTALMVVGAIMPIVGKVFVATGGEVAAAGFAAQAGWWWVLAIIAALAILVAVAVSAAKAAKAASLAGQLEKAEKATAAAAEAAEKAKSAYDELLGEKNKYSELQSSLENLTKGTDAWKQALMDANAQVLNLLTTYPELAQYVGRGEDGQLVIFDDGWGSVIKEQEAAVKRTQSAVMSSQVSESRLEKQILDRNYKEKFKNNEETAAMNFATGAAGVIGATVAGVMGATLGGGSAAGYLAATTTRDVYQNAATSKGKRVVEGSGSDSDFIYDADIIDKINDDLSNIGEGKAFSNLEEFYGSLTESTGKTREELQKLVTATNEYNAALLANQVQLQAQAEAALQAGASEEFLNSQYSDSVTQGFAKQMSTTDYSEQEKAASKAIYTSSKGEDAARKTYMEGELHINSSGDELKDLELIYKKLAGRHPLDEIPDDLRGNKQALADAIGVLQTSTGQIEKMEDFQKKLNQVNGSDADAARSIAGLMSGDASQFTKAQLDQAGNLSDYAKSLGYKDAKEMAIALGYGDKNLSELEQEDQQAFAKTKVARTEGMSDEGYQKAIDGWIATNGTVSVTAEVQMDIDSNQYEQQMIDAYDKASAGLASKGVTTGYDTFSIDTVKNLSNQVGAMSDQAAQDYVANFNKVLSSPDLGESSKKRLEAYLSSVDWSNMTDAVKAMDYMQEAGVDPTVMKEYWDSATDGAHTFVSTLAEALSLIDRLQGKLSGVTDIADKLSKGTATYEEMNQLIAAGADISGFQLTAEGWKATSEEIETATGLLRTYYAEQATETAKQHAQELANAKETQKDRSFGVANITEYNEETGKYEQVTRDDGVNTMRQLTEQDISTQLGINAADYGGYGTDKYWEAVAVAYQDYLNLLNNGEEVQTLLEKQEAYAQASQYTADENFARGGTDESVRYSMQNEAEAAGLDPTKVTEYSDRLVGLYGIEQQLADRIALDNSRMNAGIEELGSNWEDWGAVLKDGKKGTQEYSDTLADLKKNMKSTLNITGDLSDGFFENAENVELMQKASEGDVDAIEALRKAAAKDILVQAMGVSDFSQINEDVQNLSNYLSDYAANNQLELGAHIDDADFINSLNELIMASGMTAQQANDYLSSIGYQANVTEVESTSSIRHTGSIPKAVPDGAGGFKIQYVPYEWTETSTSMVPQITSVDYSGPVGHTINTSNSGGGKKGGGGGGKKEKWENPHDELYNLTEKANEALRQREKIERDYDRLLKNRTSTSKQILANSLQEIANLQKEIALQKQLQAGRSSQISKLGSETFKDEKGNEKSFSDWGVTKYASYDETTGTITIDWEAINKITDTEKGAAVEEYISKLEELSEQFEETQDTIEDMEDIIREIQERGKTEYVDFEQRIYDALVAADQAVIDNLSEINDSINDSNARLLDSIQTAIDEQRQARERDEQRNDIEEKQRRLALLKSDTSGANALEIKKLEEEIGDLQQSYTDSLVDDSLAQLQQQNDDAAEQRERQIEIMQNQLDYAAENGAYWEEVSNLLSTAFNPDGSLNNNSALIDLLKETEGFKALSEFGEMQWIDELIESWLVAQEGLANWKIEKAKQSTNGVQTQNAGTLKYDSATGLWNDTSGGTYSTLAYDPTTGQYKASGYTSETSTPAPTSAPTPTSGDPNPYGKASATSGNIKSGAKGNAVKAIQYALNKLNYGNSGTKSVDGIFGPDTVEAVKAFQKAMGISADGIVGNKTREKFKVKGYLKGGLADYTGPAWMDGTPSKPELVLDAKDTQNFIVLKNILADVFEGHNGVSEKSGDNYFEIHIEVDKLENDYDVEQVAEKVKRVINEDARYRNVNAINVLR